MSEMIHLLVLLVLAVCGNILGGIYTNINLDKFAFDWKKLITGIIKAFCVIVMFVVLAIIVENVPDITQALGVEPKALLMSVIVIYATKIVGHLMRIFGLKKENVSVSKKEEVKPPETQSEEFVDI